MLKRSLFAILICLAIAELLLRALPVTYRIEKIANLEQGREIVRQNGGGTYSSQFDFVNVRQVKVNRDHFVSATEFDPQTAAVGLFGDSFTEALMVDHKDKIDTLLQRTSGSPVFNFAKRGDTGTDALAQLRYARANYRLKTAVLIFGEDAIIPAAPANGAFYLDEGSGELVFSGLAESALRNMIGHSALARYLFFNLNLNAQFANTVARLKQSAFGGALAGRQGSSAEAPLPTARAQQYLSLLLRLWNQAPQNVCLVFNSDFTDMYEGKSLPRLKPAAATLMALARARGIQVIDMSPIFAADFINRKIKFDSAPFDRHWNAYGHLIVAKTLQEKCLSQGAQIQPESLDQQGNSTCAPNCR